MLKILKTPFLSPALVILFSMYHVVGSIWNTPRIWLLLTTPAATVIRTTTGFTWVINLDSQLFFYPYPLTVCVHRAAKVIFLKHKSCHISLVLKMLQGLPIPFRVKVKDCTAAPRPHYVLPLRSLLKSSPFPLLAVPGTLASLLF